MGSEIILKLLAWAVVFTGYDMPADPPMIQFVPHSVFVQSICRGVHTIENPCTVRAMYNDFNKGTIYLDEAFTNYTDRGYVKGIIMHEMVHYLQDMSGEWKDMYQWEAVIICQERRFRELEAYLVQDTYMEEVHSEKSLRRRYFDDCGGTQ